MTAKESIICTEVDVVDDDGFILVTRKKNKKKVARAAVAKESSRVGGRGTLANQVVITDPEPILLTFQTKFSSLKRKIQETPLFASLVTELPIFQSIVCYGLGSLEIFRSQLQLALICAIRERFPTSITSAYSYDPCHSQNDKYFIRQAGFVTLEENDQGRRDIGTKDTVLFFMPHCDRWLYCNVLEKQQHNLDRIYILGNSFIEYEKKSSEKDLVQQAVRKSVEKRFSLLPGDSHLDSSFMFESFNDLRLISFFSEEEEPSLTSS